MVMDKILVGSASFFKGMEGYNGKDNFIKVIDEPREGSSKWWSKRGEDTFEWVRHGKEAQLRKLMSTGVVKRVAALLTPELAMVFGVTVEDIRDLEYIWNKCEGKTAYYKVIADAYIENGVFVLTEEQKAHAFEVYKEARNATKNQILRHGK